jgi:DNA repair exonuclease SbcCD nuclease subunit
MRFAQPTGSREAPKAGNLLHWRDFTQLTFTQLITVKTGQNIEAKRRLRLIHTADVHIGEDDRPAPRLAGLKAAVDATIMQAADVLLIVGDFFDNARVASEHIEAAYEQLARLSIPVLMTPGNHDCLLPPCIYERAHPSVAGAHVRLMDNAQGSHVVLRDLGLTVWARALVDHHPGHNPLEGYRPLEEENWQVALAHGHYVPASERADRSSPLLQAHIGLMGCDYLALGHWHRFLDVTTNRVPAFYPGSPSEAGGSYPSVNLVTLDPETGVSVERILLRIPEVELAPTSRPVAL